MSTGSSPNSGTIEYQCINMRLMTILAPVPRGIALRFISCTCTGTSTGGTVNTVVIRLPHGQDTADHTGILDHVASCHWIWMDVIPLFLNDRGVHNTEHIACRGPVPRYRMTILASTVSTRKNHEGNNPPLSSGRQQPTAPAARVRTCKSKYSKSKYHNSKLCNICPAGGAATD